MVNVSPTGSLYVGTSLNLTCTVTLDPNVNNNESVSIEWSGLQSIPQNRYSVTGASEGSGTSYTGTLTISPLTDQDDGLYTCTVTVTGGTHVLPASNSNSINITVIGILTSLTYISCTSLLSLSLLRPTRARGHYFWYHYWSSWRGAPVDMYCDYTGQPCNKC